METINQFKVLLIGDSCTDHYRIGTVDRISPEAPVPIFKIVSEYQLPGMASNVRENLSRLQIDQDFVTNQQEITKTRYIDRRSGQHLLRVDHEPALVPWNGRAPNDLSAYDAVVVSDYDKGFLTYEDIENLIKKSTGPVFIDTKKRDLLRFCGAFVKINFNEFNSCTSINDQLIVTLGPRGAMYKKDQQEEFFETQAADVVDVCGCGDTFLAALVYKFLNTQNIRQSIDFANRAARITVQRQGNYAPSLGEIDGH